MNSGTIHLIATDPPFNKNKDFHATPDSLAAGASFQDRWSWRDDLHDDWLVQIQRDYPDAWRVMTLTGLQALNRKDGHLTEEREWNIRQGRAQATRRRRR